MMQRSQQRLQCGRALILSELMREQLELRIPVIQCIHYAPLQSAPSEPPDPRHARLLFVVLDPTSAGGQSVEGFLYRFERDLGIRMRVLICAS